jgi:hypothetical protein
MTRLFEKEEFAMSTSRTKLWAVTIMFTAALGAVAALAQDAGDRSTDQFTCKDIMRENASNRDVAIAFVHGIFLGKSGNSKFNINTLQKQTDAFIERCLDNPNEKALDAMTKVKN